MNKNNEKEATAKEKLAMDYRNVFDNDPGRRVLADLKKKYHIHKTTAVREDGAPLDANLMIVREGERRPVLYIMKQLTPKKLKS